MDAFASPSIRAEGPGRGGLRALEAGLTTLLLWLSLMSLPLAPDARLDGSWQEMLVRAHAEGLQFGRDLIFTWGPWGFLGTRYHLGRLEAVPLLLWQTLGQLLIALALVVLTYRLAAWRRVAFAVLVMATQWLFQDTVFFILILLVGIVGLVGPKSGLGRLVGWTLVLGFLAQLKFTYFVIAAAGVLAAAATWAAQGARRKALAVLAGFGVAVILAWVAAGQNLDNLYPYLRRSLEIASGYGDAMGLDESWPVFLWGAGIALGCLVYCWRLVRHLPGPRRWLAAYLAFTLFVMWKEAYTRADGHVFGFFCLVLGLAPVLGGIFYSERRWHWFDAAMPACLVAFACLNAPLYGAFARVEYQRIVGNTLALAHVARLPDAWQAAYLQSCAAADLPKTRALVGTGTVDAYDYNTAAVFLNGMRLAARPIFQGYSAYTPSLEGWNLRYFQSNRAPDYLLWDDDRVDGRYPGEDDAMLVAALPGHYQPVLAERNHWLFRRETPEGPVPARQSLLRRSVQLGEELVLPPDPHEALWLQADAVPNLLGRLRAPLYKPPTLNLATTDLEGRQRVWRLLPRVARAGFLLVPTLESGADLADLMAGETRTGVRSLHFEAPAGQEEFWSHVDVEVSALPALPLRPLIIRPLVEGGIVDRRPESVTSVEALQLIELPEGPALQLHAEGEMAFAFPPGATALSFGYGIRPGAYTGEGHTDGVEFDVDRVAPDGRRERLWSRYLDPVAEAGDRGTQHITVALPAGGGGRVILHTGPGPRQDNRWDWSYVAAVRFTVPSPP
jgi:hypothetical protein